jgi:hypothetical protein
MNCRLCPHEHSPAAADFKTHPVIAALIEEFAAGGAEHEEATVLLCAVCNQYCEQMGREKP